jgi:two-component system NtrC family sensor kinase
LLKVARPATGARTLVDLNRVIEDIVAILAHDINKSGIDIKLDLASLLPPLREDESRLDQVFMNLVLNAIQSMDGHGGTLKIATGVRDGGLEVDIEDTGCGIPPELLKRIYEPFFTTKPTGQGTGLGLFITHQIVSEMNGNLQVGSTLGKGTRFRVRIPTGETGKIS